MNTPSLRKTRAAVGSMIGVVNNNATALDALTAKVKVLDVRHAETREMVDALLDRGFIGRLKWLVTGH